MTVFTAYDNENGDIVLECGLSVQQAKSKFLAMTLTTLEVHKAYPQIQNLELWIHDCVEIENEQQP